MLKAGVKSRGNLHSVLPARNVLAVKFIESNALCLKCGLCCNGVIFADVQLQAGDDAARLRSLGLVLAGGAPRRLSSRRAAAGRRFAQPCTAFDSCRCRVYDDRPKHCREFDCLLLKRVQSGEISHPAAERIVRQARRRSEDVKRLLRELGDTAEQTALGARFRQVKQRMESGNCAPAAAEVFSRLTLAYHDLTVILSESFYRVESEE